MTSTEHIQRAQATYDAIAEIVGHQQKILVVDDDSSDVLIIKRRLGQMPLKVDVAYSVETAIPLIEENHYFLVLVDLAMPGQGGSVLIEWMSKRPSYMRRVVCTGSTKSEELDRALKFGPLALMSKDFTAEHFLQLLYLVNCPVIAEYAAVT